MSSGVLDDTRFERIQVDASLKSMRHVGNETFQLLKQANLDTPSKIMGLTGLATSTELSDEQVKASVERGISALDRSIEALKQQGSTRTERGWKNVKTRCIECLNEFLMHGRVIPGPDQLEAAMNCTLCLGVFETPILVPESGQSYCQRCFQDHLTNGFRQDPLTKVALKSTKIEDFPQNYALMNLIDAVKSNPSHVEITTQCS